MEEVGGHFWRLRLQDGTKKASRRRLEAILAPTEGDLRVSRGVLEASWRRFGTVLERLRRPWDGLGGVLGAFWMVFLTSWTDLFSRA